ncbi:MAG TPA: sugar phosphate isomerase/epimerase [Candidatus Deferrimicrobium sp.]|nr:sugar phosphate isomerase/epimerase [Candidatus Deferrimicrobium sp.]
MKNPILLGLDRGVWDYSFDQICKKCVELQIDGLEIQPEHPEIFKNFPDTGTIKKILSDYDIKHISVHAPIKDINISSYNPRIRETSILELKKTVKFASEISNEILYIVVHGGQNSFRSSSNFERFYLPTALEYTINALKNVIKDCIDHGITLSIENMTYSFWRLSSKIKYLDPIFEQIPDLKFTLDYAHGLHGSEKYSLRLLKKFENRLISVHIGNYFEIKYLFKHINHLNPFIIIEPHHLRQDLNVFTQLQKIIIQIRALH